MPSTPWTGPVCARRCRVLVIAAGARGLTVAALGRSAGHDTTITARQRFQQPAAERLGLGLSPGQEHGVVDDAGALSHAVDLVAPGGTILLLSMYPPGDAAFPTQTLMMKEATVITSTAYRVDDTRNNFRAAALHLRDHPELAATLITHHFPLDEAATAFAVARDRDQHAIKVLVHPGRSRSAQP